MSDLTSPSAGEVGVVPTGSSQENDDDGIQEDDEGKVYEDYQPRTDMLVQAGFQTKAVDHPAKLVETSLLTSVVPSSPSIQLEESLGDVVRGGLLSAPQVESVVSACEAHQWRLASGRRAGFVLGDGAGVGKGRQLAAMILDSWLRGRERDVWVSVSHELVEDARRDLRSVASASRLVPLPGCLARGRDRELHAAVPMR